MKRRRDIQSDETPQQDVPRLLRNPKRVKRVPVPDKENIAPSIRPNPSTSVPKSRPNPTPREPLSKRNSYPPSRRPLHPKTGNGSFGRANAKILKQHPI